MFSNRTVFILGAGASWHYGYPTGEQLVKEVIKRAGILEAFCRASVSPLNVHRPKFLDRHLAQPASTENMINAWKSAEEECRQLAARLHQVDPLVIDYFLGQNPQLQSIGKLLIAWVILQCNAQYEGARTNQNRSQSTRQTTKDNWYRFIIHKLVRGCARSSDLAFNNVTFVTFNYDFSLEQSLHGALSSIELFNQNDVDQFFMNNRVIHIYGKVRECPPRVPPLNTEVFSNQAKYHGNPNQRYVDFKTFLDDVLDASQTIQVIDPDDKHLNKEAITAARHAIAGAKVVFILGYGFDENNSNRLELRAHLAHPNAKAILFTNFGDSNQINKRASELIYGQSDFLLPPNPPTRGNPQQTGWYYEKSVRDVYGAFEFDFDALEEKQLMK